MCPRVVIYSIFVYAVLSMHAIKTSSCVACSASFGCVVSYFTAALVLFRFFPRAYGRPNSIFIFSCMSHLFLRTHLADFALNSVFLHCHCHVNLIFFLMQMLLALIYIFLHRDVYSICFLMHADVYWPLYYIFLH